MENKPGAVNAFNFMVLRSPKTVARKNRSRNYIDDVALCSEGYKEADLFTKDSTSSIGKDIYTAVFCQGNQSGVTGVNASSSGDVINATAAGVRFQSAILWRDILRKYLSEINPSSSCPHQMTQGLLESLGHRRSIFSAGRHYIVPDRVADIDDTFCRRLDSIAAILNRPPLDGEGEVEREELYKRLMKLFDSQPLYQGVVFNKTLGVYSIGFSAAKRKLFDVLYLLYILRRQATIDMSEIIAALGVLHALEAVAWNQYYDSLIDSGTINSGDTTQLYWSMLNVFPELQEHSVVVDNGVFPLITDVISLQAYLVAKPVIHKIFAYLHSYRAPFNPIRPPYLGDLKVVKQWLCQYKAGEIAHIENVLQGETKSRVHRRLERSEDTFSLSNESQQESTRDTQSTDRFELKQEADRIIKTDLNINVNTHVNVKYGPVIADLGAGMAFNRSQTEQQKSSSNYAKEVVEKAVKRVQSRVSEQRTSTRLYETEETNKHKFENTPDQHVSGIYRWVDKVYHAQVFNYGQREMFEFILPEPAAFLVEARLHAFETTLEVPKPPILGSTAIVMPVASATAINEAEFNRLSAIYDLSGIKYPDSTKRITFIDPASNSPTLEKRDLPDDGWLASSYACQADVDGYKLIKILVDGMAEFRGTRELNTDGVSYAEKGRNTIDFIINGWSIHSEISDEAAGMPFTAREFWAAHHVELNENGAALTLGVRDGNWYNLTVRAVLELSDAGLDRWRRNVFNIVYKAELQKHEVRQAKLQTEYEVKLSNFRNQLNELRSVTINELIQGKSSALNIEVIQTELKRQCLAMIAREFDSDTSDDYISKLNGVGELPQKIEYRKFDVTEKLKVPTGEVESVTAGFTDAEKDVEFTVPHLGRAFLKGKFVQFLEQAFEWQHLSYITYPYFWASTRKWVEMMNRSDIADHDWASFLRAGSVKVLLSVTPGYEEAVTHFLATGIPWEGGDAPIVGDPLHIALHDELRNRQDDLEGAEPEGTPWTFTVPTSLVYLDNSSSELPKDFSLDLNCPHLP